MANKLEMEIVEIDAEADHVHVQLFMAYPPKLSVSIMVNNLKSMSSRYVSI